MLPEGEIVDRIRGMRLVLGVRGYKGGKDRGGVCGWLGWRVWDERFKLGG